MEFFKIKKDIPFMSYGRLTTSISLITFLLAIFFLFSRGLNLSVEFTGGTLMEVQYSSAANIDQIRSDLDKMGMDQATVQVYGSSKNIMLRLPNKTGTNSSTVSNNVFEHLKIDAPDVQLKSVEYIGPQVGRDLINNGLMAIAFVCIGIMLYLALRFEWRFAVSAIVANMHDVVIILGCFAAFQWEFSLTVLAAILAVLGYSVNESVVVFDRIRENFRTIRGGTVPQIINNAITATMSRTIITHGCTEMMVLSMLFFGGPSLHYFALALTIGILFGIYSSVLVASPIVMWLGVSRENLLKPAKRKDEAVV
ncbi:MAG: protein translocase subunit SecF [Burkholderiales bacterium]|jgi:preprotein translocase subunit SecF|nr:protein translocase subunit SecF [Burkholderiales bacterium]MBP9769510.1 protein translocase subunit SecF [Burkholderiales bacterium]